MNALDNERIFFRSTDRSPLQFRATPAASASVGVISGYGCRWNELSSDRGNYFVRLLPGSAKFSDTVFCLFNHDPSAVIGNSANGSLTYSSDSIGVKFECDLPNTSIGRDTLELVRKGYVTGMSFAMAARPNGREITENGKAVLEVSSFVLDEFSVCPNPSFERASVAPKFSNPFPIRTAQSLRLAQIKIDSYRLPDPADYE